MQDHTTQESSPKLCECGCGQPTEISRQNHTKFGWIKGQPKRFIRGHTSRIFQGSLIEAFWTHCVPGAPDECWFWQGTIISGYGAFKYRRKMYKAHRVSYEIHHGPIPDGMCVCHTCDNPA